MKTLLSAALVVLTTTSCLSYRTPGRGADLALFMSEQTDEAIAEILAREPAAEFPANLAVARVQAPGYRSHSIWRTHGGGAYTVVTVRDVEKESDLRRLRELPDVAAVAPLSGLLVPSELRSDQELRLAAARLRADVLLIYTFDTSVDVDQRSKLLAVASLGLLPTRKAAVTTTASALLLDTRTGFLYGLAETTAEEETSTNAWSEYWDAEDLRRLTEREAFEGLLDDVSDLWAGVRSTSGGTAAAGGG